MKTLVQLKGDETINLAHIVRFVEHMESVEIFLSDGTARQITDPKSMSIFSVALREHTIFTY